MTDSGNSAVEGHRIKKAVGVVAGIVAAACLMGAVEQGAQSQVLAEALSNTPQQSSVLGDDFALSNVFVEFESEQRLPFGFSEEVVDVFADSEVSIVRVNEQESVVSYVTSNDSFLEFALLRNQLEQSNWVYVNSGQDRCGTFVKNTGLYRWVFVTCVQWDDGSSVVIHYAKSGAEEG